MADENDHYTVRLTSGMTLQAMSKAEPRYSKMGAVKKGSAAFSLLELLTVVAVLGILAALLLAGQKKALRQAGLTNCAANLRQISVGFNLYNSENDGTFPPHWGVGPSGDVIAWYGFIAPYFVGMKTPQETMSKVFHCPTNPRPREADINYLSTARNVDQSYGYNYSYLTSNPEWSQKLRAHTISDKTKFVLAGDIPTFKQESDIVRFPSSATDVRLYPAVTPDLSALNGVSQRHGGGANFLFLDGHVEYQISRVFARDNYDRKNWIPTRE